MQTKYGGQACGKPKIRFARSSQAGLQGPVDDINIERVSPGDLPDR